MERRTAIITGSASGLGRALALRLARDGWRLALADIDDVENARTLEAVQAAGGEGLCEHVDVSSVDDWRRLHDRLRAEWPRLDLLVNNAGVGGSGEVGVFTLDDWRFLIETNLMSVVYGCHIMLDWLKENPGRANICNISSIASQLSLPRMAAYCAAKSGVVKLSESLRVELAAADVGVTVVCAGFFTSRLLERARMKTQYEHDFTALSMQHSPLTADSVAEATLRAVARRRFFLAVTSWKIRGYWWFSRLAPRAFMNYVTRVYLNDPPAYV
mgnify:CR=1 FL=1